MFYKIKELPSDIVVNKNSKLAKGVMCLSGAQLPHVLRDAEGDVPVGSAIVHPRAGASVRSVMFALSIASVSVASMQTVVRGAQSVTLAWNANTETNLAGYRLYWGTGTRSYSAIAPVLHPLTTVTITNLQAGTKYFFAVTAYTTDGLESDYSDEVSYSVPGPAVLPASRLRILTNASVIPLPKTVLPLKNSPYHRDPAELLMADNSVVQLKQMDSRDGVVSKSELADAVIQDRVRRMYRAELNRTLVRQ